MPQRRRLEAPLFGGFHTGGLWCLVCVFRDSDSLNGGKGLGRLPQKRKKGGKKEGPWLNTGQAPGKEKED